VNDRIVEDGTGAAFGRERQFPRVPLSVSFSKSMTTMPK